jgi:hypothetical protein
MLMIQWFTALQSQKVPYWIICRMTTGDVLDHRHDPVQADSTRPPLAELPIPG